jgi:hypothetical protein
VAIVTPARTYYDYVEVPASGLWDPLTNGWPQLAKWAGASSYSALRFQSFTPGDVLTPAQIVAFMPSLALSPNTIDITAPPLRSSCEQGSITDNTLTHNFQAAQLQNGGARFTVSGNTLVP